MVSCSLNSVGSWCLNVSNLLLCFDLMSSSSFHANNTVTDFSGQHPLTGKWNTTRYHSCTWMADRCFTSVLLGYVPFSLTPGMIRGLMFFIPLIDLCRSIYLFVFSIDTSCRNRELYWLFTTWSIMENAGTLLGYKWRKKYGSFF